jgi:hypothetical protein
LKTIAGDHSEAERVFANEILERTKVDPLAIGLGLGCLGLFWLVIYLTLWR